MLDNIYSKRSWRMQANNKWLQSGANLGQDQLSAISIPSTGISSSPSSFASFARFACERATILSALLKIPLVGAPQAAHLGFLLYCLIAHAWQKKCLHFVTTGSVYGLRQMIHAKGISSSSESSESVSFLFSRPARVANVMKLDLEDTLSSCQPCK
jgi:hypothetical protein